MNFLKPKRKFGQNFLTDDSIAKDIVSFLSDSKTKTIIEIGPGKGILTKYLLKISNKQVKFVEIDEECVSYLKNKYPNEIKLMIGLHPTHIGADYKIEIDHVKKMLGEVEFSAVGEIGIDLYWNKKNVKNQINIFIQQIEIALSNKLPIVVHCRDAFDEVDLILGPTTPDSAFKIGEKLDDPIAMYLSDVFTVSTNLSGLPAISIPMGLKNELPIGLQIIGNHFDESKILSLSHHYKQITDWQSMMQNMETLRLINKYLG